MNLFLEAFAWIFAPAQWTGTYALPKLLGEHLALTAISVLIAAAIAIPIGWLIGHTGRGREIALADGALAQDQDDVVGDFGEALGETIRADRAAIDALDHGGRLVSPDFAPAWD